MVDGFLGGGQGGLPLPGLGQPDAEVVQRAGQVGEVGVGVGFGERAENAGYRRGEGGAEQGSADGDLRQLVHCRVGGLPECLRVLLPEAEQPVPQRGGLREGRGQDRRGHREGDGSAGDQVGCLFTDLAEARVGSRAQEGEQGRVGVIRPPRPGRRSGRAGRAAG